MTESMNWVEKEAGIDGSGMAHSTWRDIAILSFPSLVFNLLFCVVLNVTLNYLLTSCIVR